MLLVLTATAASGLFFAARLALFETAAKEALTLAATVNPMDWISALKFAGAGVGAGAGIGAGAGAGGVTTMALSLSIVVRSKPLVLMLAEPLTVTGLV